MIPLRLRSNLREKPERTDLKGKHRGIKAIQERDESSVVFTVSRHTAPTSLTMIADKFSAFAAVLAAIFGTVILIVIFLLLIVLLTAEL